MVAFLTPLRRLGSHVLWLTAFSAAIAAPAEAATIGFQSGGTEPGLHLVGRIAPGDSERLRQLWMAKAPRYFRGQKLIVMRLYLKSDGGAIGEAFRIGRFVRDSSLLVLAPRKPPPPPVEAKDAAGAETAPPPPAAAPPLRERCADACALVWLAGRARVGNAVFFTRPPERSGAAVAALDEVGARTAVAGTETQAYFEEIGLDFRAYPIIMAETRNGGIDVDELRSQVDIEDFSSPFQYRLRLACGWTDYARKAFDEAGLEGLRLFEAGKTCALREIGKLQQRYWLSQSQAAGARSWWPRPSTVATLLVVALGGFALWRWRRRWERLRAEDPGDVAD